jgi:lipopolysaccharide assembly outer membrane protein LptD (OstA)
MSYLSKISKISLIFYSFIVLLMGQESDRLRIVSAEILENKTIDGESIRQFRGDVIFKRGDLTLYTNEATQYFDRLKTELSGSVRMETLTDTLRCDTLIFFDDQLSFLMAFPEVVFQQENKIVTCDTLYYWPDQDSTIAIGSVVFNAPNKEVNTEKFTYWETDGFRGISFIASGGMIFTEENKQISANSAIYSDDTQTMILQDSCSIIEPNKGLFGNEILIQYDDSVMNFIDIKGNSSAYSNLSAKVSETRTRFQQFRDEMKCLNLTAHFDNDDISFLSMTGMAETMYHVVEDSVLMGVNNATGDTIRVSFTDGTINRIQVNGDGRGEFIPEQNNTKLDSTITYRAAYIDYHVNDQITYLETNAMVDNLDTKLTAGFIEANWENNILLASPKEDVIPTVTSSETEPLSGEFMEFNLSTQHGKVVKGKTKFNSGDYWGEIIYRDKPNLYHVSNSIYSSCELDKPHFYFASKQMKMIKGERVIAKPMVLYIYDIPIVGIPFAVFPNKGGGRHSGWIMPSLGSDHRGTFFQGLGYFWAPNDYFDALLKLNFIDKQGVDIYSKARYEKRYKYKGYFSSKLHQTIRENDILDLFTDYSQVWDLNWHHSQVIDPTQHLNVDFHYLSNNSMYQDYGWDQSTRLKQKIESKLNYSKKWTNTKNSISVNLSESYDLMAHTKLPSEVSKDSGDVYIEKSRSLPRINFNHSKTQLFGDGKKSKWYQKIYWSYNSSLINQQKIGLIATASDTWETDRDDDRNSVVKHSFSLTSPQKLFGWLNLNPKVLLNEDWIFKYRNIPEEDSVGNFLISTKDDDINGFKRRLTGNLSLSASTKLHGVFPINIGTLSAIRHVVTPTISFTYKPNFSEPFYGNDLGYYEQSSAGDIHDYFVGSMAGGTSKTEKKSISMGLQNVFQSKVQKVNGSYEKLDFLTWSLNTSYNTVSDSLKLSPIRSSIRTNIPGGLKLDISMTHDMYETQYNGSSWVRVNQYLDVPRLTSVSASTNISLKGQRWSENLYAKEETVDSLAIDETDLIEPEFDDESSQVSLNKGNLWEAGFGLRYSLNEKTYGSEYEMDETFWLNANLKIQITENWKLRYNARFDMIEKEMLHHSFNFSRPLHCWEFNFRWTPSGPGKGYFLLINVKTPDLKESVKFESRGGKRFWKL